MSDDLIRNLKAIAAFEQNDLEMFRRLSMAECGDMLMAACRGAAAIEAARRQMDMPPAEPAPWPESTWAFLKEAARRAQGTQLPNALTTDISLEPKHTLTNNLPPPASDPLR
jgi:hypothetical protein